MLKNSLLLTVLVSSPMCAMFSTKLLPLLRTVSVHTRQPHITQKATLYKSDEFSEYWGTSEHLLDEIESLKSANEELQVEIDMQKRLIDSFFIRQHNIEVELAELTDCIGKSNNDIGNSTASIAKLSIKNSEHCLKNSQEIFKLKKQIHPNDNRTYQEYLRDMLNNNDVPEN